MFVVDTNILVHAANPDMQGHDWVRRALEAWREDAQPWFATWPILYEFLRVAMHPNVFEIPRTLKSAWSFVNRLLYSPDFDVLIETERHREIVDQLVAEYSRLTGSVMHDFHTVALMREHGVMEIRTADKHFDRFTHLRVVNPLEA